MYWGKSLDQCNTRACFNYVSVIVGIQKPSVEQKFKAGLKKSPASNDPKRENIFYDALKEKRSLKKCQNVPKSPQPSTLKTTSRFFDQTKQFNYFQSPNKFQHQQNSNLKVFSTQQNNFCGQNQFVKQFTQSTRVTEKSETNLYLETGFGSQSSRLNNNPQISSFNQQNHLNQFHKSNFIKGSTSAIYCHRVGDSIKFNNQERVFNSPIRCYTSPVRFTFQSPSKPYQTNYSTVNQKIPNQIPINFNHECIRSFKSPTEKPKLNQISQQYRYICRKIQTLHDRKQIVSQQFPPIREQNQTYQQSKQIMEDEYEEQEEKLQELSYENLDLNFVEKNPLLNEIMEVSNAKTNEQIKAKLGKIQNHNSPRYSQQTSVIEAKINHQNFQLSCQQFLAPSFQNFVQQPQVEQSIVQDMALNIVTPADSSASETFCLRRPTHQPSIAIKLIQNKLRGHAYQVSESNSNQQFVSSYRNDFKEDQSQFDHESRQMFTKQNCSRWKQLVVTESEAKSQNFHRQTQKLKVTFNLEDGRHSSEKTDELDKMSEDSLIQILSQQKENALKASRVREVTNPNILQQNIFNDATNFSFAHSDNSSKRKCSPYEKKFKTLVNKKVTIHSILQQQSSSSSLAKTSQLHNNTIMSKFLLDDHLNGILSSRQNIERDESTVIGRYTFSTMEQK